MLAATEVSVEPVETAGMFALPKSVRAETAARVVTRVVAAAARAVPAARV